MSKSVDIIGRNWSKDIVLQSLLNEHEEVLIGPHIYSFIDNETGLEITDESIITEVRNFKDAGYTNIYDVFMEPGVTQANVEINGVAQVGNLGILKLFNAYDPSNSRSLAKATTDTYNYIFGEHTNKGCPQKLHLDNFYVYNPTNSTKVSASYSIDWGDGGGAQPLGTFTNLSASHSYSVSGNYNITIYVSHGNNNATLTYNVNVVVGACGTSYDDKTIWYYPATGWAMRATVMSFPRSNDRYKARSEAFRWKNGKWRKRKADHLYARAEIETFNQGSATGCANAWFDNINNDKRKARSVITAKRVNVGSAPGWKSMKGTHGIQIGGTWYYYDQYMYPCN